MTVNTKLNTGKQWGLIKNDRIYGKLVTATGLWIGQRNSRQILQLGSESLDPMNQLKPQIPFARLCTQILIVYTCRITDIHPLNRASQSRLWFNKAFENIITHLIMLKEVIYCSICQCYTNRWRGCKMWTCFSLIDSCGYVWYLLIQWPSVSLEILVLN